jgi:hypothetical protein
MEDDRTVSIVTTFHEAGYHEYGKRMMETLDNHLVDKDIPIWVLYEDFEIPHVNFDRFRYANLSVVSEGLQEFKERHKNNSKAHGKIVGKPQKYRMQTDAVKFAHKAYALLWALKYIDADILIWMDADVYAHADITKEFLLQFLPDGCYCSYLGRAGKDTETGYIMFDTKHLDHAHFVKRYREYYDHDLVFTIEKWIDGLVFDYVMKDTGIRGHNISQDYPGVHHPFIACKLGECLDHLKGFERKKTGASILDKDKGLWAGPSS